MLRKKQVPVLVELTSGVMTYESPELNVNTRSA